MDHMKFTQMKDSDQADYALWIDLSIDTQKAQPIAY